MPPPNGLLLLVVFAELLAASGCFVSSARAGIEKETDFTTGAAAWGTCTVVGVAAGGATAAGCDEVALGPNPDVPGAVEFAVLLPNGDAAGAKVELTDAPELAPILAVAAAPLEPPPLITRSISWLCFASTAFSSSAWASCCAMLSSKRLLDAASSSSCLRIVSS